MGRAATTTEEQGDKDIRVGAIQQKQGLLYYTEAGTITGAKAAEAEALEQKQELKQQKQNNSTEAELQNRSRVTKEKHELYLT